MQIDAQIEAVLFKIAAAGLNPRRHLGASLATVQPHLLSLRHTYGCNVCGEGGEYETLTLDCPLFTHGRIILDAWETVHVSEDSMAPVALLHPTQFHVESKGDPGSSITTENSKGEGRIIEVPDDYTPMRSSVGGAPVSVETVQGESSRRNVHLKIIGGGGGGNTENDIDSSSSCFTLAAEVSGPSDLYAEHSEDTVDALVAALQAISDALATLESRWEDALFVHLYVPAMTHFAAANAAYSRFLPAINPPARATVQIAPNSETSLVVEVLFRRRRSSVTCDSPPHVEKKVLHVQSISEWAPSCIGPYSQAVAHQGLVYFAGQIPLDPPTMAVAVGSATAAAAAAAVLSLRSCQAVAVAMRTDLRCASLWWTVYTSHSAGHLGRVAAENSLLAFLQGDGGGETQELLASHSAVNRSLSNSTESDGDDEESVVVFVDEYLRPPVMQRHWGPPLITFIEIPELPRGVTVEVQPVAWSSYGCPCDEDSSSDSDSDNENGGRIDFNGPQWVARVEAHRQILNIQNNAAAAAVHAEMHVLHSPGNIFKGSVFITLDTSSEEDKNEGMVLADVAGEVAVAVQQYMHDSAVLSTCDVVALKIYAPATVMEEGVDGVRESVNAAFKSVKDDGDAATKGRRVAAAAAAVVVPVLRVGPNASASAHLCIEVFARKM